MNEFTRTGINAPNRVVKGFQMSPSLLIPYKSIFRGWKHTFTLLFYSVALILSLSLCIYAVKGSIDGHHSKCAFDLSSWLLVHALILSALFASFLLFLTAKVSKSLLPVVLNYLSPSAVGIYLFWLILGTVWVYQIEKAGYYCDLGMLRDTLCILTINWAALLFSPCFFLLYYCDKVHHRGNGKVYR